MYIGDTEVTLIYGLHYGEALLVLLAILTILLPLLCILYQRKEKGQTNNKYTKSSFCGNKTSCKLYSVETGSIPKDPGDENRVYDYVDLQSGITFHSFWHTTVRKTFV